MRLVFAALLTLSPGLASAADGQRKEVATCPEWNEKLMDRLTRNPPYLSSARVPKGLKIGRCLFEVKGKRLIDGKCAYAIRKDGEFEIQGPRQVYPGLDYPDCYVGSFSISTDHFIQVDHELLDGGATGPGWWAHWNEDKRATHAHWFLGSVAKRGACFINSETKICLWKQ